MKKKLLTLLLLSYFFNLSAQEQLPSDGCGTDFKHQQLMATDPVYAARVTAFNKIMKNSGVYRQSSATYIIPVVVHVMHNGEPEGTGINISDADIYEKIKVMNQQFRDLYGSSSTDIGIEFALAVRNPSNQCTNGIVRVDMTPYPNYISNGMGSILSIGMPEVETKNVSRWDPTQYYNIWVVSKIDGAYQQAGFAYFASHHGSPEDGAVVLSGSMKNPLSSTESHELGHALNLYHTFQGDGVGLDCPTEINGCDGTGDCCEDTPPHRRDDFSCDGIGQNICDGNSSTTLFSTNFMNYSPCQRIFTLDQKERMIAALITERPSFLVSNGNNKLIPPSLNLVVDYVQDIQTSCVGMPVTFTDRTPCVPNTFLNDDIWPGFSFSWTFTNGSETITSSLQNPRLIFTQTGSYNLTYTITNSSGSYTKTVPNVVMIYNPIQASCIPQSSMIVQYGNTVNEVTFNTISRISPISLNEEYMDLTCSHITTVISGQTYPLTVSIRASSIFEEVMEAYIDYDNSGTFDPSEKVLEGMSPVHALTNITGNITIPDTAIKNVRLRMRIIGEGTAISDDERNCNATYLISDVEDYGIIIQDALLVPDFGISGLQYFPNPVNEVLNISAKSMISKIQIHTILGQLVSEKNITSNDLTHDFSGYGGGMYIVSVFSGDNKSIFKVLKN